MQKMKLKIEKNEFNGTISLFSIKTCIQERLDEMK